MSQHVLNCSYVRSLSDIDSYGSYRGLFEYTLKDKRKWKQSIHLNTQHAYEEYLSKYPSGIYVNYASKKLNNVIEKEKQDWKDVKENSNTKDACRLYLEKYPNGLFSEQATEKLNRIIAKEKIIEEKQLWLEIKNKDTRKGYEQYLNKYPLGSYSNEAMNKLDDILAEERIISEKNMWENTARIHTQKAYEDYLNKYPTGQFRHEATIGLDELISEEKEAWRKAVAKNGDAYYWVYLDEYPGGLYKVEAKTRIDEIREEREHLSKDNSLWRDAQSSNTKDTYETYLIKYPDGVHCKEALNRINDIVLSEHRTEFNLGTSYSTGKGVPKDLEKAKLHWEKGAIGSNYFHQFELAIRYLEGDGLPKDPHRAIHWLKKAATQEYGVGTAACILGCFYADGYIFNQNSQLALSFFEQATKEGCGNAAIYFELGRRYADNEGIPYNYNQAIHWLSKSINLKAYDSYYATIKLGAIKEMKKSGYIDNFDGTITDQKTGLMWKKYLEGAQPKKYRDSKKYLGMLRYGNRISSPEKFDYQLSISPQNSYESLSEPSKRYGWSDAINIPEEVNKNGGFAGYSDWRISSISELNSLYQKPVDYYYFNQDKNPTIQKETCFSIFYAAFPATYNTWSSSEPEDFFSRFFGSRLYGNFRQDWSGDKDTCVAEASSGFHSVRLVRTV